MVHKVKDRPSAHITTGQQKAPELRAVITPLWSPFECICPPGFHSPPLRFQKMSWPWAADRRLTLKNTSMKYNTTPFPPTSSQSQGLRQLAAAQGDADTPDQGEKEAHDPPGFLMPPHLKKKKNVIGQISFISSGLQKASLRVCTGRQQREGKVP